MFVWVFAFNAFRTAYGPYQDTVLAYFVRKLLERNTRGIVLGRPEMLQMDMLTRRKFRWN